jgi:hypothetical protein
MSGQKTPDNPGPKCRDPSGWPGRCSQWHLWDLPSLEASKYVSRVSMIWKSSIATWVRHVLIRAQHHPLPSHTGKILLREQWNNVSCEGRHCLCLALKGADHSKSFCMKVKVPPLPNCPGSGVPTSGFPPERVLTVPPLLTPSPTEALKWQVMQEDLLANPGSIIVFPTIIGALLLSTKVVCVPRNL